MAMAVAKRELGRTGLQVTTLGYGAMELRGAPRARDITEAQAETILNEVLEAGINYIDTSIDYGLSEERIGRYISHRRAEYYLASKCGCLVGAPPAPRGQRGQQRLYPRERRGGGRTKSGQDEDRLSRRFAVPLLALPTDPGRARRTRRTPGTQTGPQGAVHRHVRHLAPSERPHCHECLRCLPNPVLGGRA